MLVFVLDGIEMHCRYRQLRKYSKFECWKSTNECPTGPDGEENLTKNKVPGIDEDNWKPSCC